MRNECGNEVIMAANARIQVLAVGIGLCDKCEFLEKLANAKSGMVVGPGMIWTRRGLKCLRKLCLVPVIARLKFQRDPVSSGHSMSHIVYVF